MQFNFVSFPVTALHIPKYPPSYISYHINHGSKDMMHTAYSFLSYAYDYKECITT